MRDAHAACYFLHACCASLSVSSTPPCGDVARMSRSMEADVIVVGGGLAGLSAAISAAAGGARVSVLEQGTEPRYLCNSRITMGVFQIALNDMESGTAALVAPITQATRGHVDAALAEPYAGEAAISIRWLRAQSIRLIRR